MSRKFTNVQEYLDNIQKQIHDNLQVHWDGYGTWAIKSFFFDHEGCQQLLKIITHNEEDNTGIFDGEKYNPLCGFRTMEELEVTAKEMEMPVEQAQDIVWRDTVNDDNYEPINERNERLTKKLITHYEELIGGLIEDFRGVC